MKTQWYKGLDSDAKKEIQLHFNGSVMLRRRLTEILEGKVVSKDRESMDATQYENPNWAYKQADAQGYKRAINEIISLIT